MVMRDIAILRRAAELLNEPLFVFSDDAKDFFNQLAISSCDLHKLGVVFLDRPEDVAHASSAPRLVFVSEKRLGFGTHGASNIAQRFGEALLFIFRRNMDAADAPFIPAAWKRARAAAQSASAQPCFQLDTQLTTSATDESIAICPEQRLFFAYIYSDDPLFCVVGVARAMRALRIWRRLTLDVGLIMAIHEKRSLGTWVSWLGVHILAFLGLIVVPKDKLLRASTAIRRTLQGKAEFHVYRALCGLLEHLRAVALLGRNVMHGLYSPHAPCSVTRVGPQELVVCDTLMIKQLQRWQGLLARAAGVNVKRVLLRSELETPPSLIVVACADACFGDEDPSGMGGFCHGHFWYWRVPPSDYEFLSIPILEFMATAFNILCFHESFTAFASSDSFRIVLRSDALTTVLTLPTASQHSPTLIDAYQWLVERHEFHALAPRLAVTHLYGDCNALSDPISRGHWSEFNQRCAQMGVRPIQLALPPAATALYSHVMDGLRARARLVAAPSSPPARPQPLEPPALRPPSLARRKAHRRSAAGPVARTIQKRTGPLQVRSDVRRRRSADVLRTVALDGERVHPHPGMSQAAAPHEQLLTPEAAALLDAYRVLGPDRSVEHAAPAVMARSWCRCRTAAAASSVVVVSSGPLLLPPVALCQRHTPASDLCPDCRPPVQPRHGAPTPPCRCLCAVCAIGRQKATPYSRRGGGSRHLRTAVELLASGEEDELAGAGNLIGWASDGGWTADSFSSPPPPPASPVPDSTDGPGPSAPNPGRPPTPRLPTPPPASPPASPPAEEQEQPEQAPPASLLFLAEVAATAAPSPPAPDHVDANNLVWLLHRGIPGCPPAGSPREAELLHRLAAALGVTSVSPPTLATIHAAVLWHITHSRDKTPGLLLKLTAAQEVDTENFFVWTDTLRTLWPSFRHPVITVVLAHRLTVGDALRELRLAAPQRTLIPQVARALQIDLHQLMRINLHQPPPPPREAGESLSAHRQRGPLSAAERALGRAHRSNTDGDGPPSPLGGSADASVQTCPLMLLSDAAAAQLPRPPLAEQLTVPVPHTTPSLWAMLTDLVTDDAGRAQDAPCARPPSPLHLPPPLLPARQQPASLWRRPSPHPPAAHHTLLSRPILHQLSAPSPPEQLPAPPPTQLEAHDARSSTAARPSRCKFCLRAPCVCDDSVEDWCVLHDQPAHGCPCLPGPSSGASLARRQASQPPAPPPAPPAAPASVPGALFRVSATRIELNSSSDSESEPSDSESAPALVPSRVTVSGWAAAHDVLPPSQLLAQADAATRAARAEGLTLETASNATGYKGVYRVTGRSHVYAQVRRGERIHLGTFHTPEEGALARARVAAAARPPYQRAPHDVSTSTAPPAAPPAVLQSSAHAPLMRRSPRLGTPATALQRALDGVRRGVTGRAQLRLLNDVALAFEEPEGQDLNAIRAVLECILRPARFHSHRHACLVFLCNLDLFNIWHARALSALQSQRHTGKRFRSTSEGDGPGAWFRQVSSTTWTTPDDSRTMDELPDTMSPRFRHSDATYRSTRVRDPSRPFVTCPGAPSPHVPSAFAVDLEGWQSAWRMLMDHVPILEDYGSEHSSISDPETDGLPRPLCHGPIDDWSYVDGTGFVASEDATPHARRVVPLARLRAELEVENNDRRRRRDADARRLVEEDGERAHPHPGMSQAPATPAAQTHSFLERCRSRAVTTARQLVPFLPPAPLLPTASSCARPFLQRLSQQAAPAERLPMPSEPPPPTAAVLAAPDSCPSSNALPVPAPPPCPPGPSKLSRAGQVYAQRRLASVAAGGDVGMQLRGCADTLQAWSAANASFADFGVNANTAKKDERAWELWECVCAALGTDPLRTAADARQFPERNAHLLACLMLHAFLVCRPRDPSRRHIKPRSALAYPLAIIRIFARWGVTMPGYRALQAQLNGMSRQYLAYHGPHSLAPRRAEPMRFSMVRAMNDIPCDGRLVGSLRWDDSVRIVFIFRRLNRFLMRTAFRLCSIVAPPSQHQSGVLTFLTRACAFFRCNGLLLAAPSLAQLDRMQPNGADGVSIVPSLDKADQLGETHCPFTIFLPLDGAPDNAAAAIIDIERRHPCAAELRATTPLFADGSGAPYTHAVLDRVLKAVLTHLYGPQVAAIFSFHSYRSGLATALHAAGVPDATIMLMCRWMCPESLHVYRRLGSAAHEGHFRTAQLADVDAVQAANVPTVVGDQHFAELVGSFGAHDQRATAATAAAQHGQDADAPPPAVPPMAPPGTGRLRASAQVTPPAEAPPVDQRPLAVDNAVGRRVRVPADLWPRYACSELNGSGWAAVVVTASSVSAVVRFLYAQTADGRPYQNVRVPLHRLSGI